MIGERNNELVGKVIGVLIGGNLDVKVIVVGWDEGSAVVEGRLQLKLALLHGYHYYKK